MDLASTIQPIAIALLAGIVLHADDITAGRGSVIDWRTIRSGEVLTEGADAFDVARMFLALVGEERALAALPEAMRPQPPPPEVHAYMVRQDGGRMRAFVAGRYRVTVDAEEDDAGEAAAFAAALACAAMGLAS